MAANYTPQQIAAAIAKIESGGNYQAHSKTSSASGRYQYLDSTWGGYGGYAHAYQAPPEVQDAKALHDIINKLHAYGGDVAKTIMSWFLPAAVNNPALAGKVPKANAISPNQYVAKVMAALTGKKGAPLPAGQTLESTGAVDYSPPTRDLSDPMVQISNLLGILAADADSSTKLGQYR